MMKSTFHGTVIGSTNYRLLGSTRKTNGGPACSIRTAQAIFHEILAYAAWNATTLGSSMCLVRTINTNANTSFSA